MSIMEAAEQLAASLKQSRTLVVFAESCTAGLVSASLARIAGISDWHCGSAVTYRNDSKVRWLGVSKESLRSFTAVSRQVAGEMVEGVLERTPEADVAGAITGHLGPNAPPELDGFVYLSAARRSGSNARVEIRKVRLSTTTRHHRQEEAAELLLRFVAEFLDSTS